MLSLCRYLGVIWKLTGNSSSYTTPVFLQALKFSTAVNGYIRENTEKLLEAIFFYWVRKIGFL